MRQLHRKGWQARAKLRQIGLLMALAATAGSVTSGCGGSDAKTQGTGGLPGEGRLVLGINGVAETSDAVVSTNGALVRLRGVVIVINNASGAKIARVQTDSEGTYHVPLPDGIYTVVPSPFVVGSVTLTALPQLVTVTTIVNDNGEMFVPITYSRQQ